MNEWLDEAEQIAAQADNDAEDDEALRSWMRYIKRAYEIAIEEGLPEGMAQLAAIELISQKFGIMNRNVGGE